ncbi:MAG: hypothetical protein U9N45_01645 [Gemmatimonadota bacterium]|nr:hypothetical protein [Gemmatimonadota bacterium]
MKSVCMSNEQVKQLVNSWEKSPNGSMEKKLIEGLFLITETPWPVNFAYAVHSLNAIETLTITPLH